MASCWAHPAAGVTVGPAEDPGGWLLLRASLFTALLLPGDLLGEGTLFPGLVLGSLLRNRTSLSSRVARLGWAAQHRCSGQARKKCSAGAGSVPLTCLGRLLLLLLQGA